MRAPGLWDGGQLRAIAGQLEQFYLDGFRRIDVTLRAMGEGRIRGTAWKQAFLRQQQAQIAEALQHIRNGSTYWAELHLPTLHAQGFDLVDGYMMQSGWADRYRALRDVGAGHMQAVQQVQAESGGAAPGGLSKLAHPGQVTPLDVRLAQLHRGAVRAIAESMSQSLNYQMGMVGRSVEDLYRKAALAAIQGAYVEGVGTRETTGRILGEIELRGVALRDRVAELRAGGLTPTRVLESLTKDEYVSGRMLDGLRRTGLGSPMQLMQYLERRAPTEFIDRAGRQWVPGEYASMVAATTAREAADRGTYERMAEFGVDVVEVVPHAGACHICQPWEGQQLSIFGDTPGLPTLDEAESDGYKHPRCMHRERPVVDWGGGGSAGGAGAAD
jgi:hypothetical protein